jgi:hypothetical protein
LGIAEPRFHPFDDQPSLQFSHGSQDGKHHFAGGSASVELLGKGNELDALGSERLKGSQ